MKHLKRGAFSCPNHGTKRFDIEKSSLKACTILPPQDDSNFLLLFFII